MLRSTEQALQRWLDAGLLDASIAERIREFEDAREQPSGLRWQILLALIFGAILLADGVRYPNFSRAGVARNGKLVAEDVSQTLPRAEFPVVTLGANRSCEHADLWRAIDYFVPEHARSPVPLKIGQELWVEVTVPPSGPPRPIQLALSDGGKWQVLKFD